MEPAERVNQILADAIDDCIRGTADELRRTNACSALSRLLESFLTTELGWDLSARLDGIICPNFEVVGRAVHIHGGLVIVKDHATTVAPLSATFRRDGGNAMSVHFGSLEAAPVPYRPGLTAADLPFPKDENGWRYYLDETGRMHQRAARVIPDSSNFHAALRTKSSPAGIAKLYRKQGWTIRPCGWNEFEASNAIAEIVIEAVPVILHGAVAEPLETIDLVLAPLNNSAIDYFCECYAPDGSLLLKRDSGSERER